MPIDPVIAAHATPLAIIWLIYITKQRRAEKHSLVAQEEAIEAGLMEPASLHPLIDPAKCLGCGACVDACPEGGVLGLVNRKAELIRPSECIGHGDGAIVTSLIARGAKPDTPDDIGRTALWAAADSGNSSAVDALLKSGAGPQIANNEGVTPLHQALGRSNAKPPSFFSFTEPTPRRQPAQAIHR